MAALLCTALLALSAAVSVSKHDVDISLIVGENKVSVNNTKVEFTGLYMVDGFSHRTEKKIVVFV